MSCDEGDEDEDEDVDLFHFHKCDGSFMFQTDFNRHNRNYHIPNIIIDDDSDDGQSADIEMLSPAKKPSKAYVYVYFYVISLFLCLSVL